MNNKFSLERYLNGEEVTNGFGHKILNIYDCELDILQPLCVAYIEEFEEAKCIMCSRDGSFYRESEKRSNFDLFMKEDK